MSLSRKMRPRTSSGTLAFAKPSRRTSGSSSRRIGSGWFYTDRSSSSGSTRTTASSPASRPSRPCSRATAMTPPPETASWSAEQASSPSAPSRAESFPISASPADRPTPSPDGGHPDHGHVQHDVPSVGGNPDAGPRCNKGIATDASSAPFALSPPHSCSRRPPTEQRSQSSPPSSCPICAGRAPTSQPELLRDCQNPDEQPLNEDAFRDPRDARPARSEHPRRRGEDTAEALLIAATSNRTVFDALASGLIPDLHAIDPACRAVTRSHLR